MSSANNNNMPTPIILLNIGLIATHCLNGSANINRLIKPPIAILQLIIISFKLLLGIVLSSTNPTKTTTDVKVESYVSRNCAVSQGWRWTGVDHIIPVSVMAVHRMKIARQMMVAGHGSEVIYRR